MAQQQPEWYRVYTFDESIIEMNTSKLLLGGNIGRVTFRWTFDQPESLPGNPQLKYKSRLEVLEFNCSDKRYRLYEVEFLDASGKTIRSEEMSQPYEWREIRSESAIDMFGPACALKDGKLRLLMGIEDKFHDEIELDKAAKYARSFSQSLEQAKDFKPIIAKYFAVDYLNGYLRDNGRNWFLNLNQETAARLSPAELQRFYVASLNAGYLSCLYLISQYPTDSDAPVADEKLVPHDIIQLLETHPYTSTYKHGTGNYDYLAENIASVERLKIYTDLLEKISGLLRKHVVSARAERSKEYQAMLQAMLEDWGWTFHLYQPKARVCVAECFGLPRGTRFFEVNVPIFHLQMAEINGELKIVSAIDYFQ